jgi:uncharacterized protein
MGIGIGYRREMLAWDPSALNADWFEVAPENWLSRDRAPLHRLRATGRVVCLHGVALNLGGQGPIDTAFVVRIRALMQELGSTRYSDHLAASGDTHQLYDLFPIPFTPQEVIRVGDRIRRVQDILGMRMSVENTTYYTHTGHMPEAEFLMAVVERADCGLLLDLNNVSVNHKNHGGDNLPAFVSRIDLDRVCYLHVAGHEFDERFGLHMDTHSRPVEASTAAMARRLHQTHGLPVLLEWDNDIPDLDTLNQELACLRPSSTM